MYLSTSNNSFDSQIQLQMRKYTLAILTLLLFVQRNIAQIIPKQLQAIRAINSIKIDGNLNEEAWKNAKAATGFIEYRPNVGAQENFDTRTEVYVLYDNNSIYLGGYCHEKTKDSIVRTLDGRDNFGSSDYFGFILDTYNDKMNAFEFIVTSNGEQQDAKRSPADPSGNNIPEDFSWNAVWESATKIKEDGWAFEIRIPFSAIRFSSNNKQTWGLNLFRKRALTGQLFFWNPVDPKVNGVVNQDGELTNLENIKPPVRLSFSPYLSTYINHYPYKTQGVKDWTSSLNGGMDLKYGINSSFTLDMTLVPDFGQVQSDNKVLNLTPFEVKYNENRPFFNEGTELFNKGGLFYSRRIGGVPIHAYDFKPNSNEQIINNPTESKLINAIKISGRTSKGLGIGVFNAITDPMYATVETDDGHQRRVQTGPLTNFNIFVLNQSLKNNSALTFINTNVLRKGSDYNANVSAIMYDYNDKNAMYSGSSKFSISNLSYPGNVNVLGYSHYLSFGKAGGSFRYKLIQYLTDDKYSDNDLGLMFNNNFLEHDLYLERNWLKPHSWYNSLIINNTFSSVNRFLPNTYENSKDVVLLQAVLRNLCHTSLSATYVAAGKDFYEPRTTGRVYQSPAKFNMDATLKTDLSKVYQFVGELNLGTSNLFNEKNYLITLGNSYRFNEKLTIGHLSSYSRDFNNVGFYSSNSNDIIFSKRDVATIENILNAKYNFNRSSGLTLRMRHYWSNIMPSQFYSLQGDGSLANHVLETNITNGNLNIFNLDMVYTLEFAPGSFINIVYKNSIYRGDNNAYNTYLFNFKNMISAPQNNNLSVKIIYYLDYLKLRKK